MSIQALFGFFFVFIKKNFDRAVTLLNTMFSL